jgi:hypothetical protein
LCFFNTETYEFKRKFSFFRYDGFRKIFNWLISIKKLNINFIDVDIEIEKKLDLKIYEIFENKGEKYFRQIEETETLKALRNKKTAISLGGGAFFK